MDFHNLTTEQLLERCRLNALEIVDVSLDEPLSNASFRRLLAGLPAVTKLVLYMRGPHVSSLFHQGTVPGLEHIEITARWQTACPIALPNTRSRVSNLHPTAASFVVSWSADPLPPGRRDKYLNAFL